jgi:hypothetical protein
MVKHTCFVSRRGKGAKGTIEVSTFGKPVIAKGETVAKTWDYSFAKDIPVEEVIEAVKEIASIQELLLRSADNFAKSTGLQQQSAIGQIISKLLAENLAENKTEAEIVAKTFFDVRKTMRNALLPVPTFDSLFLVRKEALEKKAKEKASAPRLNKKTIDIPEDIDETDDETEETEE